MISMSCTKLLKHLPKALLCLTLCPAYSAAAEGAEEGRLYLEARIAELEADALITAETAEQWRERYESLKHKALDLRTASLEELLTIPLMSEYLAHQWIRYRLEHRAEELELSDLKMVSGFTDEWLRYLYPLVYISPRGEARLSWNEAIRAGQGRLSLLASRPWASDERSDYIGSPEALSLRYRWQSSQRLSLFVGADKDSYEPWSYARHRGFDSYHGHIALRDWGILRSLIVGQYRASWGEGLVLSQGFRTASLLVGSEGQGYRLSPSSSTSSYSQSQGLAIDLQLTKQLSLSAISSWRNLDGRPSEEDDSFTGLSESGLHRTEREWERRRRIKARHYGARLALRLGRLELAGHYLRYDWGGLALSRAVGASYNTALNDIKSFSHLGLSYRYLSAEGRLSLSGELARSQNKALATAHRLSLYLPKIGQTALSLRYISADYWAYHGQSHTHFARPNNEMGIGLAITPELGSRRWALQLEGDWYRTLAPRRREEIEEGALARLRLGYTMSKSWKASYRLGYRYDALGQSRLTKALALAYQQGVWGAELRGDLSLVGSKAQKQELAYALSARLARSIGLHSKVWLSLAHHRVDSWQGRIYYTEPRLSEEYRSTFLYGRGWRLALGAKTSLSSRLDLGLRLMHHAQTEPRPRRTELALQLVYR